MAITTKSTLLTALLLAPLATDISPGRPGPGVRPVGADVKQAAHE